MEVNGIRLHVEDHGSGTPVVLLHGWPDSAYLWRNQMPFLLSHGFRVIAPDLRGFGRSDKPQDVAAYGFANPVADVVGTLDALGLSTVHLVGHDWGAFIAWMIAILHPQRVERLVVLSVPHPLAPRTLRQREMAWYQLFFLFEGVAEAWLQHDDWALLRELLRGDGDVDRYIEDLSRPGALTASLNWYRANLAPQPPRPRPDMPAVKAPTLGIWSTNDHYLDGDRMDASASFVEAEWRYEQIEGASHWIPLDAPGRLNGLLLLAEVTRAATPEGPTARGRWSRCANGGTVRHPQFGMRARSRSRVSLLLQVKNGGPAAERPGPRDGAPAAGGAGAPSSRTPPHPGQQPQQAQRQTCQPRPPRDR